MKEVNSILSNVNKLTQYVLDGCNTFDTETLNKAMEIIMKQESTNASMLVYKHIIEREIAWRVRYATLQQESDDIAKTYEQQLEDLKHELSQTQNKVFSLTNDNQEKEKLITELQNKLKELSVDNEEVQNLLSNLKENL